MKDQDQIEGTRKGVQVTLTEEEVNDIKLFVQLRDLLGFEPEFEIIGDPAGEYNTGRKRHLSETEITAIFNLMEVFTLSQQRC